MGIAKKTILITAIAVILTTGIFTVSHAAFNPQINYQGKLTDSSDVAVADGNYNMEFKLYTAASGGTAIWTETRTLANRVAVTNGLFSVLLGEVSSLSGVDFNQTLYLGINIGGTADTPTWDGEMTPRKKLGAVAAAFEADKLDGIDSLSFLRSDEPDTISSSSASTLLTVTQSGTGDILNVFDGSTEVFTILDGGNIGVGTTSPYTKLSVAGFINTDQYSGYKQAGNLVLYASSTNSSTLLGIDAGSGLLSDGLYNTFLGRGAGSGETSSDNNTYVGNRAGAVSSGGYNTYVGGSAGRYGGGGNRNSFFGWQSGYKTEGSRNAFFGTASGYGNTTGSYNTYIGTLSALSNSTGSYNTVLGYYGMYYNGSGSNNTVIGTEAGYGVSGNSYSNNSLFGYRSGYALTTGSNNILLGHLAGDNLTTGSNNIVLGYNIDAPAANSANTLNIGNLLFGTGLDGTGTTLSNGKIGIGTTSPSVLLTVGSTTPTQVSGYRDTFLAGALEVDGAAYLDGALTVSGLATLGNASSTLLSVSGNFWSNGTTNIGNADADVLNIRSGVWNLTSTATTTVAMTNGINFDSNTFVIDPNSGKVGMGTANPDYRLTIRGAAYSDAIKTDMGIDLNPVTNDVAGSIALVNSTGNVDAGVHYYYTTFITALGETQLKPTSPASVTTDASNGQVTVTLPVSQDPRVTGRRIYRGKANDPNWVAYLVATVNDNVTTTYTDNIADASLGADNVWERENTTMKYITVNGSAGMLLGTGLAPSTILGTGAGSTYFDGTALKGGATLIGAYSGNQITTGAKNSALGFKTFYSLTSGSNNVAIGWQASYYQKAGSNNVAVGYRAGFRNDGGGDNVYVGMSAGYGSGTNNGTYQNIGIGSNALAGIETGDGNIAVGYRAGDNITSGSKNIVIGYDIDAPAVSSAQTLNIGNLLFGTGLDGTGTTLSSGNIGIGVNSPSERLSVSVNDTATTSVTDMLSLTHLTTGTAADGIGSGILFSAEADDGTSTTTGRIAAVWNASTTKEQSDLVFYTKNSTGTPRLAEKMRLDKNGNLTLSGELATHIPDNPVNPPSPALNRGRWKYVNTTQDAPSLNSNYFYILPNDTWIDRENKVGYLFAHIRHDENANGTKETTDSRYIHLFTFDPDDPSKLTYQGQLIAPTTTDEESGNGGILEASVTVVGDKVYIYYSSYNATTAKISNTLLATADKDDIMGTITKQGVVMAGKTLDVKYRNGLFYATDSNVSDTTQPVSLYVSADGINFSLKQTNLLDKTMNVDLGKDTKILSDNSIWFTARVVNDTTNGKPLKSQIISFTPFQKIRSNNGVVLRPAAGTDYAGTVDSPAIFQWGGKWYMYIAGTTVLDDYSDAKIILFEWEDGVQDETDTPVLTYSKTIAVNSSGYIGIGTSSPRRKLVVSGGTAVIGQEGDDGLGWGRYIDTVNYPGDLFFHEYTSTDWSTGNALMQLKKGGGVTVWSPASSVPTLTLGRVTGQSSIKANADAGGNLLMDSNGGAIYLNNYVANNVYMATGGGNVGIGTTNPGGGTTVGAAVLSIADGTAPSGGVTGQSSLYSSGGELYAFDSAGNSTLLSPHDLETNEWIFSSKNLTLGTELRVDMEKFVKYFNSNFGTGFVREFREGEPIEDTDAANIKINEDGSVGIGTTTPEYKLHVAGDVAARSFISISTRKTKEGIVFWGEDDYAEALEKIKRTKIANYNYLDDAPDAAPRFGLIAEEAPPEILSVNGEGVDLYKMTGLVLAGTKELAGKVDEMDLKIQDLEARIASGSPLGGETSVSDFGFGWILERFKDFGIAVSNGFMRLKELVVDTIKINKELCIDDVCVNKEELKTLLDKAEIKRDYDNSTIGDDSNTTSKTADIDETAATSMPDANTNTEAAADANTGNATSTDAKTTATATSTPASESLDTEPPVIILDGDNPIKIKIGSDYIDPGAVVTDNVDSFMEYKVSLNGGPEININELNVDTSAAGSHVITFTATDKAGNTGAAERRVIVFDDSDR